MIILVTGGRTYRDYDVVRETMESVVGREPKDNVMVVHGDARGADETVDAWCRANHVHRSKVPALWSSWPLSAGPKRNSAMLLLKPDVLVAFPGGRGTADMKAKARAAGIKVVEAA